MENTLKQIKNKIKEEFEKGKPSSSKILSYLTGFRIYEEGYEFDAKDEWRYLPDREFFDFMGETFKLNPEFYMKNLYKGVRKKLSKDIKTMRKNRGISLRDLGEDFKEKGFGFMARLGEMDKYIFEKYCLLDGEQILLDTSGGISWGNASSFGTLYVTNYRIISQGSIELLDKHFSLPVLLLEVVLLIFHDDRNVMDISFQLKISPN